MSGALGSAAGYAAEAPELLIRYEGYAFEDIYRGMLDYLPPPPACAIDVGAGTGRDAAALVKRGYHVTAVEPTRELREGGRARHADATIDWIDAHLPALRMIAPDLRFDLVLVMAVWMHLDADDRRAGMARLAELMAPRARLLLTLRHGPVPTGRRMFDVTAAETIAIARANDLRVLMAKDVGSIGDENIRAGVTWTHLVFEAISPP